MILTWFFGRGVVPGIYAVTQIERVNYSSRGNVVVASIHASSNDNTKPLLKVDDLDGVLGEVLKRRRRGAEIFIPSELEPRIYRLLVSQPALSRQIGRGTVLLPGSPGFEGYDISQVSPVNTTRDLTTRLQNKSFVPGFWVKPQQASWIRNLPEGLSKTTNVFGKFKAGDMLALDQFVNVLDRQVRTAVPDYRRRFGLITSVPLNQQKAGNGEVDRVRSLASALAENLQLDYQPLFRLGDAVSRTKYKNLGYPEERFTRDYRHHLSFKTSAIRQLVKEGKGMILVDDVFTDGVTTQTIIDRCREINGCESLSVLVTTLGIMTKKNNMSTAMQRRLS